MTSPEVRDLAHRLRVEHPMTEWAFDAAAMLDRHADLIDELGRLGFPDRYRWYGSEWSMLNTFMEGVGDD